MLLNLRLLTILSLESITLIILPTSRPTSARLEFEKRDAASASASGQVPVIDGIIGGGRYSGDEDRLIDHNRVHINLAVNNDPPAITSAGSKKTAFVQILSKPSACPDPADSMTGYIHLDPSRALFFWFIEARRNADQAPLVLWLNGGPGSSSMIGLFQENGPCRISLDARGFNSNAESWNENANMIYIDQPVGTGYSYGTRSVKTTRAAMGDLYGGIQTFLSDPLFSKFMGRPFGVWTESYGGHYGPVLVDYILQINKKLSLSNPSGLAIIPINSLGVGNGLTNPLVQYPSYISYARSNPYNQTLVSSGIIEAASQDFSRPQSGCRDLILICQSSLKMSDCRAAQSFCNQKILTPLVGDRDVYDVRQTDSNSTYPPALAPVLNDAKFKTFIGVPTYLNWTESDEDVYNDFYSTGDWMLDSSKALERVIDSGVRTLIYAGDADFIVNYQGVEALVDSLKTKTTTPFVHQNFSEWRIDSELAGLYKTSNSLSYLRILFSGHEVPAYGNGKLPVGRAAKVFFDQTISNQPISSPDSLKNRHATDQEVKSSSERLISPLGFYWPFSLLILLFSCWLGC